jgi:hypothetical protein
MRKNDHLWMYHPCPTLELSKLVGPLLALMRLRKVPDTEGCAVESD